MNISKYARKPFVVNAVRVTEENFDEIAAWCKGTIVTDPPEGVEIENFVKYIDVPVQNPQSERQKRAFVNDWVLVYGRGSFKVYTDNAFAKAFVPHKDEPKKAKPAKKTAVAEAMAQAQEAAK